MKNADDMLKRIMDEVDKNRDGKIQYEGAHASISISTPEVPDPPELARQLNP